MPRWLVISIGVALVCAWGVTIALTSGGPKVEPHTYAIQLDNAFGLTVGSDVKFGGVEAGAIKSLDPDPPSPPALVGIHPTLPRVHTPHPAALCQVRPQSLIRQ